jgi:hypothetical protein
VDEHYSGIIAAYGTATACVWSLWFLARPIIAGTEAIDFRRPWIEVGLVILAAALTIGVGQLFSHGLLLPDNGIALRTANQALIFAPLLLLVLARAPGPRGAGLPLDRSIAGLGVGLLLAACAIVVYAFVRGFSAQAVLASVLSADNIPHAAQVLFEDLAIAAILLRMRGAVGGAISIGLVAALFAAGHVPAMLANGATATELTTLFLDAGIGVFVFGAVLMTRSVWWFWPLHTAMDLTQFYRPHS